MGKTKGKKRSTKTTKEEKKRRSKRDYREALLADMKAIDKFCLCSVTLQIFKW